MSARDKPTPLEEGASSTKTDLGRRNDDDSLSDWIEQRQKSFWDFEKSFFQPFDSRTDFPAPPPPRLNLFSRPFFEPETDFFRRRPNMLSTRHNPDHDDEVSASINFDVVVDDAAGISWCVCPRAGLPYILLGRV
jgi:hypothetical protein